jgi:hypothetical protein
LRVADRRASVLLHDRGHAVTLDRRRA